MTSISYTYRSNPKRGKMEGFSTENNWSTFKSHRVKKSHRVSSIQKRYHIRYLIKCVPKSLKIESQDYSKHQRGRFFTEYKNLEISFGLFWRTSKKKSTYPPKKLGRATSSWNRFFFQNLAEAIFLRYCALKNILQVVLVIYQ